MEAEVYEVMSLEVMSLEVMRLCGGEVMRGYWLLPLAVKYSVMSLYTDRRQRRASQAHQRPDFLMSRSTQHDENCCPN